MLQSPYNKKTKYLIINYKYNTLHHATIYTTNTN